MKIKHTDEYNNVDEIYNSLDELWLGVIESLSELKRIYICNGGYADEDRFAYINKEDAEEVIKNFFNRLEIAE